ncbi:hypothetical protein C815_00216 [Firmicutes bacterium M10-2]|nr:hypothetical protein C815_00216 [Firmicutes bacterium M10-2]
MIVYGSQYGTAKWYAEKLGEKLGEHVVSVESFHGAKESVVFVSGLYAGGFKGAKKFQKRMNDKTFALVSCGLADPKEEKTRREIERNARAAFKNWDGPLFCVRGAIDYKRLSVLHRVMMWMMKTMIVKKGLEAESEGFLATYGSRVSFCSEDQLDPIVAYRQKNERF